MPNVQKHITAAIQRIVERANLVVLEQQEFANSGMWLVLRNDDVTLLRITFNFQPGSAELKAQFTDAERREKCYVRFNAQPDAVRQLVSFIDRAVESVRTVGAPS